MHDHSATAKGAVGVVFAFGSAGVSFMSNLEGWLRIGSLCVGICVGIATLLPLLPRALRALFETWALIRGRW